MERFKAILLLCMVAFVGLSRSELMVSLDSNDWTLQNENRTLSLTTNVPAYPLEVLRAKGVIADPLYRYGELESRWVAMETWTFSTRISAAEVDAVLAEQQVLLQLDGVDTYADVWVNDKKALKTSNFHRQWTLPIKSYLAAGQDNTLKIAIHSAFKTSLANKAAYPYTIDTLYNTGSIGAYNFARKPAFDFGWDWGPAFAASGIHGSVKLLAFSQPTLAGAYVAQSSTPEGFKLVVTAQLWLPAVDTQGFLSVSLPELSIAQQQELAFAGSRLNASALNQVEVKSELSVDKEGLQLWWPAGGNYGPQKLYDVQVSFTPDGVDCGVAKIVNPPPQQDDANTADPAMQQGLGWEQGLDLQQGLDPQQQQLVLGQGQGQEQGQDMLLLQQPQQQQQPGLEDEQMRARFAGIDPALDPAFGQTMEPSTPEEAAAALQFADADQQEAQQQQAAAALQQQQQEQELGQQQGRRRLTQQTVQQIAIEPATSELPQPVQPPQSDFAATALKGLLGAISSTLQQHQARTAQDSSTSARQCSSMQRHVGFRTVELVMDPLPKAVQELFGKNKGFEFQAPEQKIRAILNRNGEGQWANNARGEWSHFPGDAVEVEGAVPESFYFKVNGVPIYMKGANIIPLTAIPTNTTPELIMATLQAAVDANMNMLRVWGGGLYHPEDVYKFADENGLLIWQDAMFGGSHYPRTPEWLENYAQEISQQAQRLSWHPSIALWCGNNEVDLSYEWPNSTILRSNRNMFAVDYQAVFIDTVRKNIKQVNPTTIFVDSSPYKGAIVDTPELYIKRWGWIGDPRYGTIHSYNYMSDCEDFRSYPLGKFVSEFGWQSYPLPETYAAAMDPAKDWGVGNPMNEFRNRRTDVTPQFLQQYAKHFKLPQDWNPADTDERMRRFKSYLWIGNMQHMRCYETALNFWRRLRSNSKSLTMGVMYWQLNDIWAGASWSSIDVSGRWKPVHYAVKRAYAPIAVQAVRDGSEVQVFLVSDLRDNANVTVTLRLVSLADSSTTTCKNERRAGSSDKSVVARFSHNTPGLFASKAWQKQVAEVLKARPGCTADTCYLSVTAEAKDVEPSESQLFFTQFKNMALPDPHIVIDGAKLISPVEVQLTVRSQRPAPLVMLSAAPERVGHFTDNGFNLDPCEPRTVTYISHNSIIEAKDLLKDQQQLFSVDSLFNHSSWSDAAAAAKPAAAAVGSNKQQAAAAPAPSSGAVPKNGKAQ